MFSWLTPPTPDFSSRGTAKPPARFVPLPKAPAPVPRASVASHPPPPVFTPITVPVAARTAAVAAVAVPQPLGFTTGFSPNIETFKSIGDSYFVTDADIQADVSRWAIYPAIQVVDMDGNNIEQAAEISTGTLVATESVTTDVLNLMQGPASAPGRINMKDNNNITHTLESLNSNLYFDDELLAKAGDIQDIGDWALYAAVANVDMANNGITNCGNITTVAGATIDNTNGTIKTLNLDMGPADTSRINFTNEFGTSKNLSLEVGGGGHLIWEGENVVVGDVVTQINPGANSGAITLESTDASVTITNPNPGTVNFTVPVGAGGVSSLDTITGDVVLQGGAGILIGPGIGPKNISITAPTLGASTDPPGPLTAYGQANQAILDAAEALAEGEAAAAAAEAAQLAADAAQVAADAAAAEAAAASAAAAAAAATAATAEATAVAASATAAAAAAGVALIEAAYVTKVGLAGNQRSGEITLVEGANTTITEAPNGTFTIASSAGGGGVTSLNALTGAVTLVAGSGISVTPAGSNITIASAGGFDLNGLQNKVGIFPALPLTGDVVELAANNTGAPPTAIVPDATPPTSSTTVLGTPCWLYTKPVGNDGFNWYMYNPRFGAPAAPLPYKKYSNSSVIDRIQSVWALVQPAVNTNIYTAGVVAFNLYSFDDANPPTSGFYNTRWAYSNSQGQNNGVGGVNLYAGYTYLLYAYDAPRITNQTGVGQPDIQDWGLRDPYDLYTDVHHIPLQNAVISFNPWTDGTNYRTWNGTTVFTNGQTVVFSGFGLGGTGNGIFYTVVGSPPAGTPPVSATGVPSAFFVAIVPQPSSYASQPILAMALTGASGGSAPSWTAGPLLRVLSMGWTAGPDPTTTTISERYVLN